MLSVLACHLALAQGQDLFLSARVPPASNAVPFVNSFHPERRSTIRRLLGESYAAGHQVMSPESHVFRPEDFGADPTGRTDSFEALSKTIESLLAVAGNATGTFKYADLGGATLDLAGGHYTVSKELVVPQGYMNFKIGGGTISAMKGSFPAGGVLLTIGDASADQGKACMDVDLSHLVLDGQGVAGTTLALLNVQYVNVGPALMAYGFSDFGVKTDGSGGGYLHKSWLGQDAPDGHQWLADPEANGPLPTATAISLENGQHDWYVEDVIVWSAAVGVRSANQANQLQGVHTWGMTTAQGGIGIHLTSGYGKVIDSYLDFSPLVIVDPTNVVVSNNLFLATANLVIEAGGKHWGRNMVVTGNRWDSQTRHHNATIVVRGEITSLIDSVVENNAADKYWDVKSTRATKTVPANSTEVAIDFSEDLMFELPIQEVSCEVQASELVSHVVRPPVGRSIQVLLSSAPKQGLLTCSVDQSTRTHAAH